MSRDASRAWLVHGYKKVRLLSSRGQAWGSGCPWALPSHWVLRSTAWGSLLICKQVPAQWLQRHGCDPRRRFSLGHRVSSPLPILHQLTLLPVTCDSFVYPHPRWYLGLLYLNSYTKMNLKFALVLISRPSYLYWPFLLPSVICLVIIFAHFSIIGLLVFSVLTLKSSLNTQCGYFSMLCILTERKPYFLLSNLSNSVKSL